MMNNKDTSVILWASLIGLSALILFASGCDRAAVDKGTKTTQEKKTGVDFVDDVKPILQTHCIRCHNDDSLFGGLNLMTKESAMKGSARGPILVPGHPDKSLLYEATNLEHGKDPKAMPATGPKLIEAEKEILKNWIENGAEWPEGKDGSMAPLKMEIDKV